jgi:uncharacterized hydrophobic protein (TIGR00341 family)
MSLRAMEIVLPTGAAKSVLQQLEDQEALGVWTEGLDDDQTLVRILLYTEQTEKVSDLLGDLPGSERFRIMLFPVEATLPQPEPPEEEPSQGQEKETEEPEPQPQRVSREELYTDVSEGARLSTVYVVSVVLSSIVAAIGLRRGSVTVVIGAMVIAPLLGPNVALALAATLGDLALALQSLKAIGVGLVGTALLSLSIGFVFGVDPSVLEVVARTQVNVGDIVLALAAGSAGALAYSSAVPATLIGVMVAVALLPPLVASGLLAGAGHGTTALGALFLFVANVTAVNLAGVVTFLAQGIRPRKWWEAERARRATRIAIAFWLSLLIVLVVVILLGQAG